MKDTNNSELKKSNFAGYAFMYGIIFGIALFGIKACYKKSHPPFIEPKEIIQAEQKIYEQKPPAPEAQKKEKEPVSGALEEAEKLGVTPESQEREQPEKQKDFWKGNHSPFITQKFIVVRENSHWQDLWEKIHIYEGSIKTPLPDIDFSRYAVLALFSGQKNTAGYSIEITRMVQEEGNQKVYYQISSPPPDVLVSQILTQPYYLQKVKASKTPFIFVEERQ